MVKFVESCEFGEVHEQYSDVYIHIARATNAYVALTLNLDHEKVNFNHCFIKLMCLERNLSFSIEIRCIENVM